MTGKSETAWRAVGLRWGDGTARLEWSAPTGQGLRSSPVPVGAVLAFTAGADRRCVGVWRSGRRLLCPYAAPIDPQLWRAQCETCAARERSSSVATDTRLDDPRPFTVYLAHHASVVKLGITAAERGAARLLEQGALASAMLSTGTLPAARRSENQLVTALGLPDRVLTRRKREARVRPGTAADRAAGLADTAARVAQLPGWPPAGQAARAPDITDHAAAYGLPAEGLRPVAAVTSLTPGCVIGARVECRIGSDLYVRCAAGLVLLDVRLLAGWALERAADGAAFTAALTPVEHHEEPDALF